MNRHLSIGLFGLFGSRNIGNEATLKAAIQIFRRELPQADLQCFCGWPESIGPEYNIPALRFTAASWKSLPVRAVDRLLFRWPTRIRNFFWAWRCVRQVDVLIIPGTGAFDDFGESPGGFPSLIYTWALAARLARRPLMIVSVGAGPIVHSLSRMMILWVARSAIFRSYRDEISKSFMASIGLDTTADQVSSDLVFELDLLQGRSEVTLHGTGLNIGVGLMTYRGWRKNNRNGGAILEKYVDQMEEFIVWLVEHGHNVFLLTGEDSDASTVERARVAAANRIGPELAHRITALPAENLHDLARHMSMMDLVVATRYHNVVCALMCCVPSISIGYAKKNDAVMTEFHLDDYCQQIGQLDLDLLKSQVERIAEDLPGCRILLANRLQDVRKRMNTQYGDVIGILDRVAERSRTEWR